MFVELVELLRCPRDHDPPSQLVASAFVTEHRHIVEGELGCPVCRAEFPIRRGVVILGEVERPGGVVPDVEDAMRIAAFLELTDTRGFVVLCGRWGSHVRPLRDVCGTPLVLVNPPLQTEDEADGAILAPDHLPFAPGAARAAALDARMPASLVASVVRSVRAGGRLMGALDVPVPDGVAEIARDGRTWVGEKTAAPDQAPRLVTLKRAGS